MFIYIKELARSIAFNLLYFTFSALYIIPATITLLIPGRKAISWIVYRYAHRMVWTLRFFGGVRLSVVDKYKVPHTQCIIAAKHHSWFDGFCMYEQFPEGLAFVTGNHLEKLPLVGGDVNLFGITIPGLLSRMGAIVVNNCGGGDARDALNSRAEIAAKAGRNILIYPEGHLSAPGTYHRYRKSVWHMYNDYGIPVVPVATNLGCFAQQKNFWKKSGIATIQFLDPIPPGMAKDEFMALLEKTIEDQSNVLIAQAMNSKVMPSELYTPHEQPTLAEVKRNLAQFS